MLFNDAYIDRSQKCEKCKEQRKFIREWMKFDGRICALRQEKEKGRPKEGGDESRKLLSEFS